MVKINIKLEYIAAITVASKRTFITFANIYHIITAAIIKNSIKAEN